MDYSARKQGDLGVAGEAKDDFSGVMAQDAERSEKWLDFVAENGLYKEKKVEIRGAALFF
jgi:hypothetical protein